MVLRLVEPVKKTYRKRCSFAAAGFSLRDQVSPFDQRR